MSSGTLFRSLISSSAVLLRQFRVLLNRGVEIGDIGLVMLVVVQVHRRLVNVRLQGVVVVGQRGYFESHVNSSLGCAASGRSVLNKASYFTRKSFGLKRLRVQFGMQWTMKQQLIYERIGRPEPFLCAGGGLL